MDRYDVLAIVGLGLLGYGLSRFSISLALCVIGGILLVIGGLGAWWKGAGR